MGWGRVNKAGKGGKSYEADDIANQAKVFEIFSMGKGEPLKGCKGKTMARSVCLERSCLMYCGLLERLK